MIDRRRIREYIARDNPVAALELDELFSQKVSRLVDYPAIGRPGRAAATRELVVHDNYIVIYDITESAVRVLRILHVRQKWPPQAKDQ